jgi:hypothetical protein
VDGKVFIGSDNGTFYTFKAGRKLEPPKKTRLGQGCKVPPVAANGVLYVNGNSDLFAIASPKK